MGGTYSNVTPEIHDFLDKQSIFFVATAPRSDDSHVNVSPKGYRCFRVLSETRVAYLDYAGSGAETIAHLRENQRICLMFCSFDAEPNIVRIYGKGIVHEPQDPGFSELLQHFEPETFPRSIIEVNVTRVADACGYAVPQMTLVGERDVLRDSWNKKGSEGCKSYQVKKNASSIDGLPALRWVEDETANS